MYKPCAVPESGLGPRGSLLTVIKRFASGGVDAFPKPILKMVTLGTDWPEPTLTVGLVQVTVSTPERTRWAAEIVALIDALCMLVVSGGKVVPVTVTVAYVVSMGLPQTSRLATSVTSAGFIPLDQEQPVEGRTDSG